MFKLSESTKSESAPREPLQVVNIILEYITHCTDYCACKREDNTKATDADDDGSVLERDQVNVNEQQTRPTVCNACSSDRTRLLLSPRAPTTKEGRQEAFAEKSSGVNQCENCHHYSRLGGGNLAIPTEVTSFILAPQSIRWHGRGKVKSDVCSELGHNSHHGWIVCRSYVCETVVCSCRLEGGLVSSGIERCAKCTVRWSEPCAIKLV